MTLDLSGIRTMRIAAGIVPLALLLFSSTHLFSQTSANFPLDELKTYVRYLASDELEGRRTGTRGNLLAAGFIAGKFAELGLEPVDGEYLHDFPYLRGVQLGEENQFTLELETGSRDLAPGAEFLPMGYSTDGTAEGDLVFVGYGISAPDSGYDDYAGIDVRGKIAVMLRHSPAADNFHDPLYQFGELTRKTIIAREKGAVGIILIDLPHDDEETGEPIPLRLYRGFSSGIPVVTLHADVADDLCARDCPSLKEIRNRIDKDRKPNSFVMKGASASFTTDVEHDLVDAPNVIGIIPGTDPTLRDELIVIGAHFDHLGHGGEGSLHGHSDSSIHNGADDNASGTAAVIALARYFVEKGGNRRTMVFTAFNGEEEGLLGSAALVEQARFDVGRIAAMINLDMIGRLTENRLTVQGFGTSSAWEKLVTESNSGSLQLATIPDGFGPSDHSSFYAKKVPVLFFFTGLHDQYHRPDDDWDLINYDGMQKVVGLIADVMAGIDDLATRPDYQVAQSTTSGTGTRFSVYMGTIPDYAYSGKGMRLSGVRDGSPAAEGGLQGGDVIVAMNDMVIGGVQDLTVFLSTLKPNDEVRIRYIRNEREDETTITVRERK